jgi:hypothetical protein
MRWVSSPKGGAGPLCINILGCVRRAALPYSNICVDYRPHCPVEYSMSADNKALAAQRLSVHFAASAVPLLCSVIAHHVAVTRIFGTLHM